jgi:hypothetical protein
VAAEEKGEDPKKVEQEGDHRAGIVAGSGPADQAACLADGVLAKDRGVHAIIKKSLFAGEA